MNRESIIKKIKQYPKFYQKVWLACMKIPRGQVRSYKWIAQKIGNPKAYRAVGNALGKNPFAPIVPCHRVIHSDGGIGGFSAPEGIKKKISLLIGENKEFRNFLCVSKTKKI